MRISDSLRIKNLSSFIECQVETGERKYSIEWIGEAMRMAPSLAHRKSVILLPLNEKLSHFIKSRYNLWEGSDKGNARRCKTLVISSASRIHAAYSLWTKSYRTSSNLYSQADRSLSREALQNLSKDLTIFRAACKHAHFTLSERQKMIKLQLDQAGDAQPLMDSMPLTMRDAVRFSSSCS